jgi:cytochrome c biogenesis protein
MPGGDALTDLHAPAESAEATAEQASAGTGSGEAAAGPAATGTAAATGTRLGLIGWLRWSWRQLTSMRTALILLFLLALASVPGSVLPQEGIDPAAVTQYYTAHPALAPLLNRLSLFDVFAAPWFAAIYLLLFTSLAGCVLPRTVRLVGSARQQPPRAPRNLSRLPLTARFSTSLAPDEALAAAGRLLGGRRFRLRPGDGWLSAEKGYLREVGNLLFHIALLALLGSVALGGLFGYKANRLLVAGQTFVNQPTDLDVFHPGRLVAPGDLQPFSISLRSFTARYITSGPQISDPASFSASLRYSAGIGAPAQPYDLEVNHPLRVDGVRVYLIGHGYAPIFQVTDGKGAVVFNGPVPFIPVSPSTMLSDGVIKVPDADPAQLGFAGVFVPTAVDIGGRIESAWPAALSPRVSLVAYAGNLGMNSGTPQSVYNLDTRNLHKLQVPPQALAPGQSLQLPNGYGKITFVGYRQWISLAITYDPGQVPALFSAIAALAGLILSFLIRRRRLFVRATAGPDGSTIVDLGGLARSDAAGGYETEFAELARELCADQGGSAFDQGAGPPGAPAAADQAEPVSSDHDQALVADEAE